MRARIALLIAVILALFSVVFGSSIISAQSTKPDCKPAAVFAKGQSLKPTGDNQKDLTTLLAFADEIHQENVNCNGFKFKGDRVAKIQGPFIIPAGIYKATTTTKDNLIWKLKTASTDKCGGYDSDVFSSISTPGDATTGAEETFEIKQDCKVFLEPSAIGDTWTVTIEPLPQ